MEVDEAGVGRPARERLLCFVGAVSGEESAETVEGADVAAREDAEASEPAEQDVVGAPGSDSTQLQQSRAGARVVGLFECFEVEQAGVGCGRERVDRVCLLCAEAGGAELL